MSACIIQKKDLEKLGNKLMKFFYQTIHDEYILETFDEFKLQKKYYDENLTKNFLSFYKNKESETLSFYNSTYEDLLLMDTIDLFKKIEDKIKDETLDFKFIYYFLIKMDINLQIDKSIEFEIYEDLFCIKKAFLNIYKIFYQDYKYIED